MASPVCPYQISVPDSAIQNLKDKLAAATLPEANGFSDDRDSGAPLSEITRLAQRWRDGFDWRKQEAQINNDLPQYTTTIKVDGFDELNIHFVHQKGVREGSIPLIFCHGWPGSFLEVKKILPLLAKSENPSFHIVAPSLPNFGFSDRVDKAGFGLSQYAETLHKLMVKLGYNTYVAQGGDWGYSITRHIALLYPEHCLATHINMVYFPRPPPYASRPMDALAETVLGRSEDEKKGVERGRWFMERGYGYNLLQATKPATLGFALTDSPLALLAWIWEKLHDWTDAYPWTDDEALTWISIYHFSTAGPAASARIYYEGANAGPEAKKKMFGWIGGVRLGISYFPRDISLPPRAWGRTLGPVVFERKHAAGGHFAAYEVPEKLVGDLQDMFGKGGGADFGDRFKGSRL
ncbi:hypothetical protein S40288_05190 [Stachybotrys chartarum IBT 40288]|nr:hypothetical protein S40288_05190 [Stachybotrys chartarum IBT 40288]